MLGYQLIFLIAGNTRYVEAFDIREACLSVFVYHIVDGALVVFLKHCYVYDILLYILFFSYFGNVHRAAFGKDYHIVYLAAIAYILVFAQACTHKSFRTIDIQFGVAHHYFSRLDSVEHAYLSLAFAPFAIGLLKSLEMCNSIID